MPEFSDYSNHLCFKKAWNDCIKIKNEHQALLIDKRSFYSKFLGEGILKERIRYNLFNERKRSLYGLFGKRTNYCYCISTYDHIESVFEKKRSGRKYQDYGHSGHRGHWQWHNKRYKEMYERDCVRNELDCKSGIF